MNVICPYCKVTLIEFARKNYAAEIDALATQTPEPDSFFADMATPELIRAAAEINVSRLHAPEDWKLIDAAEHAEMTAANADDM
jgi:hypothetical protein